MQWNEGLELLPDADTCCSPVSAVMHSGLNLIQLVCVCVTMKKGVPDEWQARQATQTILQVSSSKHNAKKITTRVRGPFHQSITAILTEEKREEKQFTKPTHVAVYLFRDLDRDRSRL